MVLFDVKQIAKTVYVTIFYPAGCYCDFGLWLILQDLEMLIGGRLFLVGNQIQQVSGSF